MDHHPLDPHLAGPRCLLSEAQASTEAGADHHPGVQQQLSGEMVRRGLLTSKPFSQSEECLALAWVSRAETQIWLVLLGRLPSQDAPSHLGPLH